MRLLWAVVAFYCLFSNCIFGCFGLRLRFPTNFDIIKKYCEHLGPQPSVAPKVAENMVHRIGAPYFQLLNLHTLYLIVVYGKHQPQTSNIKILRWIRDNAKCHLSVSRSDDANQLAAKRID